MASGRALQTFIKQPHSAFRITLTPEVRKLLGPTQPMLQPIRPGDYSINWGWEQQQLVWTSFARLELSRCLFPSWDINRNAASILGIPAWLITTPCSLPSSPFTNCISAANPSFLKSKPLIRSRCLPWLIFGFAAMNSSNILEPDDPYCMTRSV